jgi:hypothetical protein
MTEEPIYPSEGAFVLKQQTIWAMCFDGSRANGHEIIAFVFRRNGSGTFVTNNDNLQRGFFLYIEGISGAVPEGSWVVYVRDNEFVCMTDQYFKTIYEPANMPAYRGSGPGGPGGIAGIYEGGDSGRYRSSPMAGTGQ